MSGTQHEKKIFFLTQNLSLALVEKDVIAGHVVPGSMLFTQPTLNNEMKTATYDNRGGLKVTAVVEPGNPQEETERGKGSQPLEMLNWKKSVPCYQNKS